MRSILPLLICLGCLLAISFPALAGEEKKQLPAPVHICIKDSNAKCIKPEKTQQYTLGLPTKNKDGRTRRIVREK